MGKLQTMWIEFQAAGRQCASLHAHLSDPARWIGMMEGWFNTSPLARP
jgi:polyhydroxyalkanoate synthase